MPYSDCFENAESYAESAVALLKDHKVAPHPPNFQVWYDYFSGQNPKLKKELDESLCQAKPLTGEEFEESFSNYFQVDRGDREALAIGEASDRIGSVTAQILDYLRTGIGSTTDFGDTLAEVSGQLTTVSNKDALSHLIQRLVRETKQVHGESKKLVSVLSQSQAEVAELRQHLESSASEALTDGLTEIANRRYFDKRLRADMQEAQLSGQALSLLLLDIDHFKRFNDTYGHSVGDQVLKVLARTLKDAVKGRDSPCRYGGEECAVILPGTCREDATTVAEQIRTTLAGRKLTSKVSGEDYGTITVSIGISSFRSGEPSGAFVDRADKSLYRAKKIGRNCVVVEV